MFKRLKNTFTLVVLSITIFTSSVFALQYGNLDGDHWMEEAIIFDMVFQTKAQTLDVVPRWKFYSKYCTQLRGIYQDYRDSFKPGYPPYTSLIQQVTELMCKHQSDLEREEWEILQPLRRIKHNEAIYYINQKRLGY